MHEEILKQKTKYILNKITSALATEKFYLAGGTALALQFGHRESIDLNWFSGEPFSAKSLKEKLKKLGKLTIDSEDKNTLNCSLDGIKLSFFKYPYKTLFPFIDYDKSKIADFKDIACMKLDTISSRGSKKDFIDLYFILKKISLNKLLDLFKKKYKGINYNMLHLLKSLVYFEDAENDPMPKTIEEVRWEEIKTEIIKKIKSFK